MLSGSSLRGSGMLLARVLLLTGRIIQGIMMAIGSQMSAATIS